MMNTKHQIIINPKKELTVDGGKSLLVTLAEQGIFLPSVCGGRGSCGACRCKVTKGGSRIQPAEKKLLKPQDLADGMRLACQIAVRSDLEISIPERIFNFRKYIGRVSGIIDYTYDIKGITFKLIKPERIKFKAGQYIQLQSKPFGDIGQSAVRAYSISSNPFQITQIQLIIRHVREGICSTWVHKHLKKGEEVSFTGPYGEFYLRESDADILFIASGSGKAPIKSILEYLMQTGTQRKMTYFFGARTKKDLYLTEELEKMERSFPSFKYVPVLSQPLPEDNWKGKTGYIMPYFKEFIRRPDNTEAYLCGSPGMIAAVVKELNNLGIAVSNIFYDSFA